MEFSLKSKIMKALSEREIVSFLTDNLSDWTFDENAIIRDFKFKTFIEAFSFMAAVALEAEKLNHHPDWSNSYNKVSVALTNHEAKGVTLLDFDLAGKIDQIFKRYSL
jgi:4a-hydroxytetrahydrobiopterin dehydratase